MVTTEAVNDAENRGRGCRGCYEFIYCTTGEPIVCIVPTRVSEKKEESMGKIQESKPFQSANDVGYEGSITQNE
jgi:hypothetical protein